MALGYTFSGRNSNDGNFFDRAPPGVLCPQCQSCLDYQYFPKSVEIKPSKNYDVSYTNDLRKLFSERFVAFCRDVLKSDERFMPIRASAVDLYYMFPSAVLRFDRMRRKTRFEGACDKCGGHGAVVGAHPAFLETSEPVGPGFYRTDIAFGSGKAKFPLIVVGAEWKRILDAQKFRGADFGEISD